MDKIVINNSSSNNITIDRDSYILIDGNMDNSTIQLNVQNCKATIVDIASGNQKRCLNIINDNSNIEYNIIDLLDSDVNYYIDEKIINVNSNTDINIASVCYKNKNKNYVINTSNLDRNSTNSINCFGIVKDESKLNYDITSFIKNGATKSVVKQNSSILLFDESSVGKSNPILVIEENDVKANHGSSIGKIDDETMFYLCSRGLSKIEATNLICLGKIQHLIDKIEDVNTKEALINEFKERMV